MLFSVIIPIYNAEKTIIKCVSSVINQTYKDFQIILVDDGSSDRSLEICKELEKQDLRIKSFHIENNGPGFARNYGISVARGEYIVFLDADDFIDSSYLFDLSKSISDDVKPDIIFIGFKFIDSKGTLLNVVKLDKNEFILANNFHQYIKYLIDIDAFGYSWCKVVSRELCERTSFITTFGLHEDLFFACDIVEKAKIISILDITPYNYVKAENSLCVRFRADIIENMEYVNSRVFNFYRKIMIDDYTNMIIKRAVFSIYLVLKNGLTDGSSKITNSSIKNFYHGITVSHIKNNWDTYKKLDFGKKKAIITLLCKTKSIVMFKFLMFFYRIFKSL